MIRPVLVGLALAVAASAAIAQGDPIAERRAVMKSVGAATAAGTRMARGEAAFDLAKAQDVLKTYAAAADRMHTYYPDGARTGGETTASPKIWENQADFRKRFDDWAADIKKAAANTNDLDSFKAEFTTVTRSGGGCHQTYRLSRS